MGSSMVLAASRQSFAFARDGALPFSGWLYRMNSFTKTPVNTVWFVCGFAALLGLLAFAGTQAINAVFALSVVALYVGKRSICVPICEDIFMCTDAAYSIPIAARFLGNNDFAPGPFNLGWASGPVAFIAVAWMTFMGVVFLFPTTPTADSTNMNYTVVSWSRFFTSVYVVLTFSKVVLGGTLFLSLVWYYFPKYGGVHWFTGPVPTIEKTVDHASETEGSLESADQMRENSV